MKHTLSFWWSISTILIGLVPAFADDILVSRANAQLTIIHLADVYEMKPRGDSGGLARVSTLIESLEGEGREVLVTLAGDFLSPSVASSIFKGEQMIEGFAAIGLDVATLGNHEFDFGPEVLRQRMRQAPWTWVVSNVFDQATGAPLEGALPYLVLDVAELRVGIIGLCLGGDEITAEKRTGILITDPFDAAAEVIPRLLAEAPDLVVAITHLDFRDDLELIERHPEIDLVLGGHDHFPITTMVDRALITKPGSDAHHVGRIDIWKPQEQSESIERHFDLVAVNDELGEDPETAAVVDRWESRLDEQLDVVVGESTVDLDAIAEHVRSRETNLGNLMADAMRIGTGSDIALLNGGSIRSNRMYPAGDLNRRDLIAMHPFGGIVCTLDLPGAVVLEALEHGFSRIGTSAGRFPQLSGIEVAIDPAREFGQRVVSATVDGRQLDPSAQYSVAVLDYLLEGGDGYSMLSQATVLSGPEEGPMFVATLEDRVVALGSIEPRVEGRISQPGSAATPAIASIQGPPKPILLDTDMGIDSVIGLLYLLKAKDLVDLRAITTVHGIADLKPAARNASRILDLTGESNIPVARGAKAPLEGQRSFPSFWKAQANSLGGARLPPVGKRPARNGVKLMTSTILQSDRPLTIIAMGPLTNVAQALDREPGIASMIAEIVVMGGVFGFEGNVGTPFVGIQNTVSEWNMYLDPVAAQRVFASGIPIRLIPLDTTRTLPVSPEFVATVRQRPRDQTSEFLLSLLSAVEDGIEGGWYYFWDAVAAVLAAHTESAACREAQIAVATDPGSELGRTRLTEHGWKVCVSEDVNRQTFETELLRAIFD